MADRLQLMVEAERRGILPPDKTALLAEARRRGLVPGGEQKPPEPAPSVGGMGGYNPLARRFMGAGQQGMERLGLTPENVQNPVANALGPLETVAQVGTGTAGTIAGGIAGIAQAMRNIGSRTPAVSAADRVSQVQQAMTYQPRTGVGAGMSRVVSLPGEAYAAATNRAGEVVTDVTGSPALGAAVKTAGDVAPAVAGMRSVKRPVAEPRRTGNYQRPAPDPVPTTEQLTTAARQAYKDAKESGVVVSADNYGNALTRIQGAIKEEGINPTLHPKTTAVLKQLEESVGKDLSITEAENLRRVIQEVAGDLDPVTRKPTGDAFRASKILDEFDDALDQMSVNSDARALWARSRRSQMIDDMIHRAEIRAGAHYTQAGMEHALRQEFKQLAMNPRRMRGLSKDQRAAIEKVASGGPMENILRALGKFDPTTSVVSAAGGLVTGGMLAPATGGLSMALPAVGFGAKRLATRATSKNVDKAREALVGRGMPSASQRSTTPTTQTNAAKPKTPEEVQARVQATSLEKV